MSTRYVGECLTCGERQFSVADDRPSRADVRRLERHEHGHETERATSVAVPGIPGTEDSLEVSTTTEILGHLEREWSMGIPIDHQAGASSHLLKGTER